MLNKLFNLFYVLLITCFCLFSCEQKPFVGNNNSTKLPDNSNSPGNNNDNQPGGGGIEPSGGNIITTSCSQSTDSSVTTSGLETANIEAVVFMKPLKKSDNTFDLTGKNPNTENPPFPKGDFSGGGSGFYSISAAEEGENVGLNEKYFKADFEEFAIDVKQYNLNGINGTRLAGILKLVDDFESSSKNSLNNSCSIILDKLYFSDSNTISIEPITDPAFQPPYDCVFQGVINNKQIQLTLNFNFPLYSFQSLIVNDADKTAINALNLNSTSLTLTNFSADELSYFSGLRGLTSLILSSTGYKTPSESSIINYSFLGLNKLTSIDISGLSVNTISTSDSGGAFSIVGLRGLTNLKLPNSLSNNFNLQLSDINILKNILTPKTQSNIAMMTISNNEDSNFTPGTFQYLTNLSYITFQNNNSLNKLNDVSFCGISKLKSLSVYNNPSLKSLEYTKGFTPSDPVDPIKDPIESIFILLVQNVLSIIGNSNLENINLGSGINIKTLLLDKIPLFQKLTAPINSLQYLTFSNNINLNPINSTLFTNAPNLQSLSLTDLNTNVKIDDGAFAFIPNLNQLILTKTDNSKIQLTASNFSQNTNSNLSCLNIKSENWICNKFVPGTKISETIVQQLDSKANDGNGNGCAAIPSDNSIVNYKLIDLSDNAVCTSSSP